MARSNGIPFHLFLLLTAMPALLVGAVLWYFASLVPSCSINERARLTSPNSQFDLIVFSRECGTSTGPNTQAALIPAGEDLPEDAASFVSIGTEANLQPRWDGFGNIEVTIPPGAEIYRRDDEVAGIAVVYP